MAQVNLYAHDLIDASRKIEDASDRIEKALAKLDNIMAGMENVWSGKTSKEYLARYEELKESFPQFKAATRSYGRFLNDVVAVYQREFEDKTHDSVTRNG